MKRSLQGHLFPRLDRPKSFSLSSYGNCFRPSPSWFFAVSVSHQCWGAQNWTLPHQCWVEWNYPIPLIFWQHFYSCSWWHCQPSLTQQHITDLHSTWVSTRNFLLSCFLAGYPLASTGACVCSFPGTNSMVPFVEFHMLPVSPISSAWPCASGCQHNLLAYEPLPQFYVISANTVNEIAQINQK